MKNSVYPPQCFSSQCGLCFNCTKNLSDMIKPPTGESQRPSVIYAHGGLIDRFEKPMIQELSATYINKIARLRHRDANYEYNSGAEKYFGIIPETYNVPETCLDEDMSVYRKQTHPHSEMCHSGLCQAIYHSQPQYIQNTIFPNIPIYTRDIRKHIKNDVSCSLCIACVSKYGSPKK